MAKQAGKQLELLDNPAKSHVVDLSDTFFAHSDLHDNYVDEPERDVERKNSYPTKQLIECQQSDPELIPLLQGALCESKAAKVSTCFYMQSGVLMCKWRPHPQFLLMKSGKVSHQIVVPKCYREDVLNLAHELPLAGHPGINKTYQKVLSHIIGWVFIEMWLSFAGLAILVKWLENPTRNPCRSTKTNSASRGTI